MEGASKRLQWSRGVAAQKEDGRGWWGVSVSKVDDSWWGQNATVHRSKPGIAASQPPFRPTYFPAKAQRILVLPAKVLHCIDHQQKLLSDLALETLVVLKNLSTLKKTVTSYFH